VLNQWRLIVGWACDTANIYDSTLHPLIEPVCDKMMVLAASHCSSAGDFAGRQIHPQEGEPDNLTIGRRGEWQVRMLVETVLSLLTNVCHLKKLAHRVWEYCHAHLGFAMAACNILLQWSGLQTDNHGFMPLSIAEFSL
jgi:hypothetical protein